MYNPSKTIAAYTIPSSLSMEDKSYAMEIAKPDSRFVFKFIEIIPRSNDL